MKSAGGFSPLEGEMAAKQPEGVGAEVLDALFLVSMSPATPPGRFAATLPSGGRE
jgi:hypothetical protein